MVEPESKYLKGGAGASAGPCAEVEPVGGWEPLRAGAGAEPCAVEVEPVEPLPESLCAGAGAEPSCAAEVEPLAARISLFLFSFFFFLRCAHSWTGEALKGHTDGNFILCSRCLERA
jgi:hypothetical protein